MTDDWARAEARDAAKECIHGEAYGDERWACIDCVTARLRAAHRKGLGEVKEQCVAWRGLANPPDAIWAYGHVIGEIDRRLEGGE